MHTENKKNFNTIVIGGGQAGLATGYYLKKIQEDFIILDASEKIGDSWRNRWDSLRLFSANWANALPGYPFSSRGKLFPGKDEVADFMYSYAHKFGLPVLTQTKVTGLIKKGAEFEITSSAGIFNCKNVVIANGGYAIPKVPAFSKSVAPEIIQLHASTYRRSTDLPTGNILVVGAGTSGIQIAIDIAGPQRKIYLSGNPTLKIPDFILKYFGKQFVWAMNNIMTIKTKPGRKLEHQIKVKGAGAPLINISMKDAEMAGVEHVSRVTTIQQGYPVLEDKRLMKVAAIIWCTGFHPDFSWIKLDEIADEKGYPLAYRGVSKKHKGLYFVGMTFQYALTSAWLAGVGRDAKYIVDHIRQN